jgi:DNA-binding beta-propeller fold protein YncE
MRNRMLLPLATVLASAMAAPAQGAVDVDVIATRLDNPRHVALARNGDVYVAEAGRGGRPARSRSCFDSAEGRACTGATGALTRIARRTGRQTRVLRGLASFAPRGGASAIGPHGVFVSGRSVFLTNGGPTAPTRGRPPKVVLRNPTLVAEEPISRLFGRLIEVPRRNGRQRLVADIWRFERRNNADKDVGNPLVDSNAVDVLADGRRLLVADAGGNALLRVSRGGRISVLSLFTNVDVTGPEGATVPMQAVPTGVVKGPDGAYYVSQLTGFPFPVGGAKVFRIDPATGDGTDYATGFTNAMDLAFARDGTLYVLEIDSDSLLGGSTDGGIWAVPPGGGTPVRVALPPGTLTEPGGIAVGRGGRLFVSNHAREARRGQVLRIDLDA